MTLNDMLLRVMAQIGEDASSLEEYRQLAAAYIQEALSDITGGTLIAQEKISPASGTIAVSSLEYAADLTGVLAVLDSHGNPLAFSVSGGVITAYGAAAAVRYRYLPQLLANNEEPPIPDIWHGALCDYASYRLLGLGGRERQQKGLLFMERYQAAREKVLSWIARQGGRDRLTHKYI